MFKFPSTGGAGVTGAPKALLYGESGAGKTTMLARMQSRYGKGLILSLESGLMSLSSSDIAYVPITSWDGKHDPDAGVYSWRGTCKFVLTDEFRALDFKWIGVDSLTELADLCLGHSLECARAAAEKAGKEMNNFQAYGDYGQWIVGSMKFIRDLPIPVVVTALCKSQNDETTFAPSHAPMMKGQAPAAQIPGLFDYVWALVRKPEEGGDPARPRVLRYVVTDEYKGYLAKSRDPRRRLKTVERCDDITQLFDRASMTDVEYEKHLAALKAVAEVKATPTPTEKKE